MLLVRFDLFGLYSFQNWLERWYDFGRIDRVSELEYPEWTTKEVSLSDRSHATSVEFIFLLTNGVSTALQVTVLSNQNKFPYLSAF